MQIATLYLTKPIGPGGMDWVRIYEVYTHDSLGIKVRCDNNERIFYPTHMIERIAYR